MSMLAVWGENLAELIRREHSLQVEIDEKQAELHEVKSGIDQLIAQIRNSPDDALFQNTGERGLVRPYVIPGSDAAETLVMEPAPAFG
ncbi:MAG TPA: hypothetical protein VI653_15810 [Steroidobacteraceae bacterium]